MIDLEAVTDDQNSFPCLYSALRFLSTVVNAHSFNKVLCFTAKKCNL